MAYTNAWDETAPAGTVNANTIDTIIQNLKIDLRERLEDLIADWTTDAVDPKFMKFNGVLVRKTAVQEIPHGVLTKVTWDTEDRDTHTAFNLGTGVLTIPANCDHIRVYGGIEFEANATGVRLLRLYNSTTATYVREVGAFVNTGGSDPCLSFCWGVTVTPGHTYELHAYQTSGAGLDITWAAGEEFGHMCVEFLAV